MKFFNELLAKILPYTPKFIVGSVAKRYIAGEDLMDAVDMVKRINRRGARATIDCLGENISSLEQADQNKEKYLKILDKIEKYKLDCNISVKLTNFGLLINREACFHNVLEIVEKAKNLNNFVRIDMEDSLVTDDIFEVYYRLRARVGIEHVGIAVQAYLWRTLDDIDRLLNRDNIRLCKGIYNEPSSISMKEMPAINTNYDILLERRLKKGGFTAIATHDIARIITAMHFIRKYNAQGTTEFQMLLGVRNNTLFDLVEMGYNARIYVPYGTDWYAYSIRRLKENPAMVGYIFKSIFKR